MNVIDCDNVKELGQVLDLTDYKSQFVVLSYTLITHKNKIADYICNMLLQADVKDLCSSYSEDIRILAMINGNESLIRKCDTIATKIGYESGLKDIKVGLYFMICAYINRGEHGPMYMELCEHYNITIDRYEDSYYILRETGDDDAMDVLIACNLVEWNANPSILGYGRERLKGLVNALGEKCRMALPSMSIPNNSVQESILASILVPLSTYITVHDVVCLTEVCKYCYSAINTESFIKTISNGCYTELRPLLTFYDKCSYDPRRVTPFKYIAYTVRKGYVDRLNNLVLYFDKKLSSNDYVIFLGILLNYAVAFNDDNTTGYLVRVINSISGMKAHEVFQDIYFDCEYRLIDTIYLSTTCVETNYSWSIRQLVCHTLEIKSRTNLSVARRPRKQVIGDAERLLLQFLDSHSDNK